VAVVVQQLMDQHRAMELAWAGMRRVLVQIATTTSTVPAPFLLLTADLVQDFAVLYEAHIRMEEGVAYPAAKQLLTGAHLRNIGEDMMVRRGVTRSV
jgi:hemerythrin-like domain-containing protein